MSDEFYPNASINNFRYPESSEKYNNLVNALAVCVSTPLHSNFTNLLQLVEFVETYKLIGVKKIYFYNDASSKDVGKILNYYKKQGIVEVIEWKTETGDFPFKSSRNISAHFIDFQITKLIKSCHVGVL